RVVEAAAAVADVEDHAALLGRLGRRKQLSILYNVVAGPAERGGQDIARPEEIEEIGDRARRIADMAHHPELRAGHGGGPDSAPQRLQPLFGPPLPRPSHPS